MRTGRRWSSFQIVARNHYKRLPSRDDSAETVRKFQESAMATCEKCYRGSGLYLAADIPLEESLCMILLSGRNESGIGLAARAPD